MAAASPYCKFVRGNYQTTVYTPSAGDVAAGDFIELDTNLGACIAYADIANTKVGAIAVDGGEWEGYAASAISLGAQVYLDLANNYVTSVSTGASKLGMATTAATTTDQKVRFILARDAGAP